MGIKHGKGIFKWADGASYDGDFNNNNIHGIGTYVWSNRKKYTGDWKQNKMDGIVFFNINNAFID